MNQQQIKEKYRIEREGIIKKNSQGLNIKLLKYNTTRDVVVEFDDGTIVNSSWRLFKRGTIKKPIERRLGTIVVNKDGEEAIVIEYNSYSDVTVEFNDVWHAKVHTNWNAIKQQSFKNPFKENKYGGMVGNIAPVTNISTGKLLKEYNAWMNILTRCNSKDKIKIPTYLNARICEEWLYYWNFYEWLHSQSNFDKWLNGELWAVDKDILVKGNKVYSPETCCLVPKNINNLLLKSKKTRGNCPIGVTLRKSDSMYEAQCMDQLQGRHITIGIYNTKEKAFMSYKKYKENLIRKIAKEEYNNGNITEKCCEALLKYEVEITD